ncbi:uncharacterized protein LOC143295056 [Babylonia areolata]|uniref:uncharacterized protein LOC143295056 n=1 Tax=Babylonia areolata TaxID=304850 RepID=UPI003FD4B193
MTSLKPRPQQSRPRHKPRPRSRPRLFLPSPHPHPHPLPHAHAQQAQHAQQQVLQAQVQVQWSPEALTMEELLQSRSLPLVVRCRTPGMRAHDGGPLALPLHLPILLATSRSARHLLARIVRFDNRTRTFNESVDSVVIPEDYDGHFLRLQSRTTKDKTHVKSLNAIAHDDTPAFLNLSDITSFPADPKDQSRFVYTMGNVFLVDEPPPPGGGVSGGGAGGDPATERHSEGKATKGHSVISGSSRHTSNNQSASSTVGSGSRTNTTTNNNGKRVMKCLDERGMPVLVPTNQAGEMVTIEKNEAGQTKLSVKTRDMMTNQQFPLLARYAYGRTAPRLTAFTKLLTLLDSFQETSVIACVIDGPAVLLLEIPVTSSLSFQAAANNDEVLKGSPRVRAALEVCGTRGRELSRDIKFKYKLWHRVQESARRRMRRRRREREEDDDLPSATVRDRLVVTETYVYI